MDRDGSAVPQLDAQQWTDRLGVIAKRYGVPGAALGIWYDGDEIDVAHGVLSTATGVDVRPDSLFQIGSITKLWTATMILQLVDEAALTLDSPVADVLPGSRIGVDDASREIAVRHLLTHSSGLDGDVFTDTGRGDDCVERYVGLLDGATRNHPVGAAYSYCNSGFVLLGRIVEVLDGRGWDASLRARLIEPLGLTETVTLPEEAILHRTAVGHREHPNEQDPVAIWAMPRSIGPAGLITASVHDVLAFARLHLAGGVAPDGTRLLAEQAVTAMQQPQREIPSVDGRGDAVGLAWRLHRWGGRRIIGHDGGTIGQLAYLRVDPEARLAVCLLTNSAMSLGLYADLFGEIFLTYVGVSPPANPEPGTAPVIGDLARHVGTYVRGGFRYDISLPDERLRVLLTMTGDRAALGDEGPYEFELHPVDSSGDAFVTRLFDHEPWGAALFDRFADGTPYLFMGGRATPKRL